VARYRRSIRSRAFTLIELLVVLAMIALLMALWTLNWCAEFNRAGKWTKAGGVQPQDWPPWMRSFKDY
jgi:prepilin-type N-terminal cleavage/methylation domain-containing protein